MTILLLKTHGTTSLGQRRYQGRMDGGGRLDVRRYPLYHELALYPWVEANQIFHILSKPYQGDGTRSSGEDT